MIQGGDFDKGNVGALLIAYRLYFFFFFGALQISVLYFTFRIDIDVCCKLNSLSKTNFQSGVS